MAEFQMQKISNSLITVDPAAVAAAETAKAEIQASFIMAMQRPRDEDQARAKILKACKRIDFAKDVEFKKPMGGKTVGGRWQPNYINGLSIRFAEVALKEWGNCLTKVQTLYEDDLVRRIKVSVTDLETNLTHSREPQISKTVERRSNKGREVLEERINTKEDTVYIVRATEDELMNKENAIISKIIRNEGLRMIPNDIKEESLRVARQTVVADMSQDPDEAKRRVVDGFATINVMPKDLAGYLGHGLDVISPKEMDTLRGIFKAVKDGESSWSDFTGQDDSGPKLTTKDFDEAFKDVSKTETWKDFWKQAVEFHRNQNISEDELKVDIISSGAKPFRDAYNEFVKAQTTAAEVAALKKAGAGKKKATGKKEAPKTKAAKKKQFEELMQSDEWQMYQLYRKENPKIWMEETGKQEPESIADCEEVNDRIATRVQVQNEAMEKKIVNAIGNMPNGDDIPY